MKALLLLVGVLFLTKPAGIVVIPGVILLILGGVAKGEGSMTVAYQRAVPALAPQAEPGPSAESKPRESVAERLTELLNLPDEGHITPAEADSRRAEILRDL